MQLFEGKTIVVTGAASGIGRAIARELRLQGASIIAIDKDPVDAEGAISLQADLSDPSGVDWLIETVPDGVHGLANVAGVPPTRPASEVLAVNYLGLVRLTEGLVPRMSPGASIVNLASLAGFRWQQALPRIRALQSLDITAVRAFCAQEGLDGAQSYYLSKEALIVWTLQKRWAWQDRHIRMNCVSPGPVDTPILDDFVRSFGNRVAESISQTSRPGSPSDIAPLVAFLLSPASGWIRGANIPVDGGAFANILCEANAL